jgi:hypothetical protein
MRDDSKAQAFVEKLDGVFLEALAKEEIDHIDAEAACLAIMLKISKIYGVLPEKMVNDLAQAFILDGAISANNCDCDDCKARRAGNSSKAN